VDNGGKASKNTQSQMKGEEGYEVKLNHLLGPAIEYLASIVQLCEG
jgi:hypothetical protein